MKFCAEWLWKSPYAEKYRRKLHGTICVCYNEEDFIAYLNQWVFPNERSVLLKNLGKAIPRGYQYFPAFNF